MNAGRASSSARKILLPLALAQFICSFAGSNMNVMITDISEDLGTTVAGVQLAITLFLLVMAALMIPGGKLTDLLGRKWCLILGLLLFGTGALVSALRGDGKSNILSTPSVLTLDNQEAEIKVAQEVPFLTGQYSTNATATTATSNTSGRRSKRTQRNCRGNRPRSGRIARSISPFCSHDSSSA
jgi:type II secretory pathway component GspD/PulD (secretin)